MILGKILVVGEEAVTRHASRAILERSGYQVCEAGSYDQAIALVDTSLDLVLVDVVPGEKTGIEVLRFIRQHHSDCPVVMISGHANKRNAIDALHEGAVDYLEKPIAHDELLCVVQRWLSCHFLKHGNARLHDYRVAKEALREHEANLAQFKFTLDHTQDGVFIFHPDTLRFLYVNHGAMQQVGYGENELLQMTPLDIKAVFTEQSFRDMLQPLLDGRMTANTFETTHLHKDGHYVPVEIVLQLVPCRGQGTRFIAFSRDITERKLADAKIKRLSGLYAALSQCSHAIVYSASEDELFPKICRAAVQFGGMKMAWIGWLDEDGNRVKPVSAFGAGKGYLDDIRISANADDQFGQGPIGIVMRENRPYWCQDFLHEPILAPWYESGARSGWGSMAALPLHRKGKVVGAFALYAGEINTFDEAERNLLAEMAMDVDYALETFDLQAERKLAERVLRQQKAAVDTMFDGLLIVDDQGVLLEANQAYARMSGYSVDELSGMHLVQLESREQSMNEIKAHIAKIIRQGRDLFETRHRCKDGHEIEVEVSVSYIPDSRQFLAFYRDITERKRTEEKLQLTQFVSDHAPDCIFWIDEHARAFYVNQAACHVLGYTQEELLAMSCVLDFAPDFPADGWPAHWQELKQQGSLTFETRHRRKDGSIFPVEISANLVRFGEKEFNIAYSRDITERKQIEADLRIAAVAFETQDAILITDIDAHIVRVNQAFSEVTGYSAEEVLGRNPRLMSSGRHERSFYIEMWQELQHTGSWAGEIWDKRKNGEVYPKWVSISAVRNELQETSHYVAIFSDITKRKQVEEEIHNLAFYDALTRLPNRRLFLDRLQTALNASIRRNDYGAVMFIDLDHFKALNDTFGHDYGDLLLLEVGLRVKSCVREMDTVARFGGDEFVVLIESFSNELNDAIHKVSLVAEKIREALVQPYTLKNQEYNSSSSIGICLYHGNEETLETLIEHADMAMYEVKRCGRNAVRFFDPGMQHSLAMHDALVKDLHHALTRQQFQLQYQIQVGKDNHPLGAEAFLRWMHPEHGTIMPGKFIKIAEESALIIDIDRWVLKSACKQLALWSQNDKTRDLILTVNISAKLFAQPDFVSEVDIILKMYQADPVRLKLELSERIVQSDLSSSIDKIRALRRLGCKLSIDNFGTVYSSLSFLKLLSPDQLKIHQEFVHNISLDVNDAQLAHIVIDYAKSLNLNVFAEGVETEQQQAFLVGQDCDIYQGYLFSRPVPIEEFEALL